jgi:hypothetical protein
MYKKVLNQNFAYTIYSIKDIHTIFKQHFKDIILELFSDVNLESVL